MWANVPRSVVAWIGIGRSEEECLWVVKALRFAFTRLTSSLFMFVRRLGKEFVSVFVMDGARPHRYKLVRFTHDEVSI